MVRRRVYACWFLALLGCSPSSDDAPCGGAATCPEGFACHDHGEGYRCYAVVEDPHDGAVGNAGAEEAGATDAAIAADASAPSGAAHAGANAAAGGATAGAGEGGVGGGQPNAMSGAGGTAATAGCRQAVIDFVVDGSGSMCAPFGSSTRWSAVRVALLDPSAGVVHRAQDRAQLGVTIYDGTVDLLLASASQGSTPAPDCAAVAADVGAGECPRLLDAPPAFANAAAIEALYPAVEPGGSTPTDKAMAFVVDSMLARITGVSSDERLGIVLISDGLPNDVCVGGTGGDGVEQQNGVLAAIDRAAVVGITIHVVSMFSSDAPLNAVLTLAAQRGAPADPTAAPHRPSTEAELGAVLEAIVTAELGCAL